MGELFKKVFVTAIIFCSLCFSVNAHAFSIENLLKVFEKDKPKKPHIVNHRARIGAPSAPMRVKVGIYVLHLGKYDLQSAHYNMDFYLIFKCDEECSNIQFEIMNASAARTNLVAKNKNYLVYRVSADLNKNTNLRNYPFDNHALDVVIESSQLTNEQMIFEVDPTITGLDSDLSVVGFQLLPTWKANVTNHFYGVFQQTYSSYKFNMFITRPWMAGLLKGILPALIIILCNFLALFMKITHTSQRLGISTSSLIAAEVFHLNLTASIPPLGYITFADMFMFINYLCLLAVIFEVVLTTHFIDTKHQEVAEFVNKIWSWSIPALWTILQTINWFVYHPSAAGV